ncbi:MAG: hypothetical protein ACYS8W_08270 [Planctomycetota bacterium]
MVPRLRKFPYPFSAAVAICNDCDLMSPEDFREIHEFLNTDGKTSYGEGLGLDIGDSVFWYNNNPYEKNQLSYWDLDGKELAGAAFIRDAIKEGWIDCLHTWGDFSHRGGFSRKHAETAAEEIEKHGIELRVWLNHGDRHNFQNVSAEYLESLGDVPKAKTPDGKVYPAWEYHTDITISAGVRYFWNHTLTGVLGQERPLSSGAYYRELSKQGRANLAGFAHAAGSIFPKKSFPAKAAKATVEYAGFAPFDGNNLLIPHVLGDGQRVCRFRRWGDWKNDTVEILAERFSRENLETLCRREAYAITYAHFGKRKNARAPLLPEPVVNALKLLKMEYENKLWVARTSRLLDYNRVFHAVGKSAVFRAGRGESADTLYLAFDPVADPLSPEKLVSGEKSVAKQPRAENLRGLTWYFDGDKPPRILYRDRALECGENPPDRTGHRTVTLTGKFRQPE